MNKNVAYCETITHWLIIPLILIYSGIGTVVVYFEGLEFRTYLFIAFILVVICAVFLFYWRYTIQIDDTTIVYGYHFTGKEKVLLNTIEYAEIFIPNLKSPAIRFGINKSGGPPVLLEGRWSSGALIRLRLNEEYLTRYKLKRKKKVKQLILRSRKPESVLSVLAEKGVPVQRMQQQGTE